MRKYVNFYEKVRNFLWDITMWLVTINDNKMNVVLSNHLLSSLKIRLSERRDWERAKVKA